MHIIQSGDESFPISTGDTYFVQIMTYDNYGRSLLRMSNWFKGFSEEFQRNTVVSQHTVKQNRHNEKLPFWFRKIVTFFKYDTEYMIKFSDEQIESLSTQCSDR